MIDTDCDELCIDKVKDGKVYFRIGKSQSGPRSRNIKLDEMRVYDIKTNQMTVLEKCKSCISKNYYVLNSGCKLDQVNNRLYVGLALTMSTAVAVSWDLSTGKIFKQFDASFPNRGHSSANCLTLDKDRLYIELNGKITVFNTETGERLHSVSVGLGYNNGVCQLLKKIDNYVVSFNRTYDMLDIHILEDENLTWINTFKPAKGRFSQADQWKLHGSSR